MKIYYPIYKFILFFFLINIFINQVVAQEDTTNLSESFDALLNLSLKELMEVDIVTAAKKEQKLSEAPSIISAVTKLDIEKMGVTSLIDVLKYIPGIETSMGVNGDYRVSVRGERKDGNILVLIDGHHINNFYDGKSIYDLPVDFIERVEVIRGPGSAIYGTNAVVGVINIITKNSGQEIYAHAGTNNTYAGTIMFNTRDHDNTKFSFICGLYQTDGANVNPYSTSSNTEEKTNRWLKDVYFQNRLSSKNLDFSIFGIWRNQGSWVGPLYDLTQNSEYKSGQVIGDISYKFHLSNKFTLKPILYIDYILHDFLIQERPEGYVSGTSVFVDGAFTKEKYNNITVGSEIQALYNINSKIDIISGLVYENLSFLNYDIQRNYRIVGHEYIGDFDNYDNVSLIQKDKTRDVLAYYLQGGYNVDKLNITLGFRYDHYSDFGYSFNPRIGIVYKPYEKINFKLLYGEAFRAPTFKELYDKTNFDVSGVLGTDSLKPETIKSIEFEIGYNGTKLISKINAFYNLSKNLIGIYDPNGTGETGVYHNIGNSQNLGFELETTIQINKHVNFFINVSKFYRLFEWSSNNLFYSSYDYLNIKGDGEMKNIPTFRLNSGIDIKVKKLHTFLGINYGNESNNNNRFYLEDERVVKIDPYLLGNFYISYIISGNIKLGISANNIGKIKYSDPEESTNINLLGGKGMGQPGSTYILSLTYML